MRRPTSNLLCSLLILQPFVSRFIACNLDWPYNLPSHIKYYPEDEIHIKRDLEMQRRLVRQKPDVVRKMSDDEGEKFFLDFWSFNGPAQLQHEQRGLNLPSHDVGNITVNPILSPSIRPVHDSAENYLLRIAVKRLLSKRDFQCPQGTTSCVSIDRPNSCCGQSNECILIEDTGLGDVGCCASGTNCAGTISECDTEAGYSSCPDSSNGGCCIPGFSCQDIGCVALSTATVNPPRPTSSSFSTSAAPSSPATSSSSSTSSTLSCSTGFKSCAATEGGGCCPTDRACGPSTCPPLSTSESTTTNPALPPVRPTSGSTLITSAPDPSAPGACPTGFYMCSAYYRGGCCRVGRDCDSTSCPATNTEVLNSNGVTIDAPIPTGTCATGWFSCGADQGGGCCPSGYSCGDSCTATASSAPNVSKEPPSMAANIEPVGWTVLLTFGCISGLAMVLL